LKSFSSPINRLTPRGSFKNFAVSNTALNKQVLSMKDLASSGRLIRVDIRELNWFKQPLSSPAKASIIPLNEMNADEPLPTRASLLERLKDAGDDAGWNEFHRMYRGLLIGVARQAGLNEHEAEEAVQTTLIAVAKKMPEFRYVKGKDSFKGWLLQIVRWRIVDQVRLRRRKEQFDVEEPGSVAERLALTEERELDSAIIPANAVDPRQDFNALWDEQWEQHLLAQALERVKRQAKPEQYAIYHLHVIEELPVAETSRTLGVSAASVYLAKHRVGALIKKEISRLREDESR
jgi:RNA polymerase sigma-70 factor (ECF subfamily)